MKPKENKTKMAVNGTLYSFVYDVLHYKKTYGSYVHELFREYRRYCLERDVAPLPYRKFRESLAEIFLKEMPDVEFTKKNNRYFVLNVISGLEL